MIENVYAVQKFDGEVWMTVFLSSFLPDAEEVFDGGESYAPGVRRRLVKFAVQGVDFIATYARDFAVLDAA